VKTPLRLLLLEDDPVDADLVAATLSEAGLACTAHRVDTRNDFIAALASGGYDLILADYSIPGFDGMTALSLAREQAPDIPFLFVSATIGEELAIDAMHQGATDYVLKQRLGRLVPSVQRAIRERDERRDRKRAEEALAQSERQFRQSQKMEAVGRLAGGIAHDFNNILGGILGYAEMLAEKAPPGSPLKRYADNVLSGATRASGLVEQILSYSRSQRGKRAPVDLGRVVTETLELVRGSLPAGISLHYEVGPERAYVVGDATQLHQVTMNLCTNACHAMPAGGTLRVKLETAKVAADRQLAHTVLHAGDYACLTVEDTGTGMDEATLARIFEPFFTTKEVGKGTGLGLALVYGIVTDSAGAIDVVSTPGRGSRFAIYLPRVEEEEMRPAAGDDASPLARGQGERVLVVDDEEALVAVTSEVLKHIGYEPVGCSDGAAALAAFDSGHIDAVIADEVMPGMSGTQLATALRRKRADLPIVLVSGYTGPILTERALGAGVTEILKKPVQSREIARALARVLHSARASTT